MKRPRRLLLVLGVGLGWAWLSARSAYAGGDGSGACGSGETVVSRYPWLIPLVSGVLLLALAGFASAWLLTRRKLKRLLPTGRFAWPSEVPDMGSTRRLFLFAAVMLGSQVLGPAFALDDPPDGGKKPAEEAVASDPTQNTSSDVGPPAGQGWIALTALGGLFLLTVAFGVLYFRSRRRLQRLLSTCAHDPPANPGPAKVTSADECPAGLHVSVRTIQSLDSPLATGAKSNSEIKFWRASESVYSRRRLRR